LGSRGADGVLAPLHAVIFQNLLDQTAILRELIDEGYPAACKDLAARALILTGHIKRFVIPRGRTLELTCRRPLNGAAACSRGRSTSPACMRSWCSILADLRHCLSMNLTKKYYAIEVRG